MRIVRQTCVRWRRLARRALVGLLLIIGAPAVALGQTERVEYYALDAIGSVRVVFDASGNILGRMDFGPFGMDLNGATGMPPERFAGLTRDGEAGLDYAQARMYQSRTGRFGAPDPVYAGMLDPQQWNRYAYAANSPTTLSDPTGLCAECQWVTDRELNIFVLSLYRFLPNDTQNPPTKEKNLRGSGRRGTPPETPGDPDPPPPPPGPTEPGPDQNKPGQDPGSKDPKDEPPPTECRPGFVDAAHDAWIRAGAGFSEIEAGFWIVERGGTTTYPALPFTNERGRITNLRVPMNARGLFHTHPNSSLPEPSQPDIRNSNRVKLPFYVGSRQGLWLYDPGAKTSRELRPGLTWTQPCKK